MPNAHARYWINEDLKKKIEDIAAKMDRSASYVAEKLLEASVKELETQVGAAVSPADSLRNKIGKIKK